MVFIHEATVGNCAVLSQALGTDGQGDTIFGLFPVQCLDKDGKPTTFSSATHYLRLGRTIAVRSQLLEEMVAFCRGYHRACETFRRGRGSYGVIENAQVVLRTNRLARAIDETA